MAEFIFSPQWFFTADILIDVFSFIVLTLVSFYSYRFYRLDPERRQKLPLYLGLSFALIGISFFVTVGTHVVMYFWHLLSFHSATGSAGIVTTLAAKTVGGTRLSYWVFAVGIAASRFIHLTGLYMLYCIYQKRLVRSDVLLVLTTFFLLTYFSHNAYFAFHVVSLVLLGLIGHIYNRKYIENRKTTTLYLMLGFMALALSQFVFIFKTLGPMLYVTAQLVQLLGYGSILTSMLMVFYNGKKKK